MFCFVDSDYFQEKRIQTALMLSSLLERSGVVLERTGTNDSSRSSFFGFFSRVLTALSFRPSELTGPLLTFAIKMVSDTSSG